MSEARGAAQRNCAINSVCNSYLDKYFIQYLIHLLESDEVGVLPEASTADHHAVFSDETMVVEANAARSRTGSVFLRA